MTYEQQQALLDSKITREGTKANIVAWQNAEIF